MCIFFAGALTGTFTTYLYQPPELYKVKKDTVPNIIIIIIIIIIIYSRFFVLQG